MDPFWFHFHCSGALIGIESNRIESCNRRFVWTGAIFMPRCK